MDAPKFDKNTEKWCGYFKNEESAQDHLNRELSHLCVDRRIVTAKKELCEAKTHGLYLYRFTVILADRI